MAHPRQRSKVAIVEQARRRNRSTRRLASLARKYIFAVAIMAEELIFLLDIHFV